MVVANMYPMVRVFVAFPLSEEVTDRMVQVQGVLAGSEAKLSFVKPSAMHLTLKFIGEIPEGALGRVQEALREVQYHKFPISFEGVSCNNPRRPRVIWTVGSDGGASAELHDLIESALEPLGIEPEGRAFTPHATIARVRHYHPSVMERVMELENTSFGEYTVENFFLKKSTLTRQGPIYEDIMEVVL